MKTSNPGYWLLKSEPETYSFDQLLQDGVTNWNEVRNYQARNYLRETSIGDQALVYHSGKEKSVVGVAEVTRTAYPDIDPEGGDWVQIDIKAIKPLKTPVKLAQIKEEASLRDILLVRQSRLSVMPITQAQFETLLRMGNIS